jgi:hypothetical protein
MSIELDRWVATFYTGRGLVLEVDDDIRALNETVAERIAWQNFDVRHQNDRYYKRYQFTISIRRDR